MMIRHTLICSALAIGWGACASAQDSDFVSPVLGSYEAGILCAQSDGEERDAPDTVAGTTQITTDPVEFISPDRAVPAVLGIGFGVRAGLAGLAAQDGITMTVTHPPFPGNGATEQSYSTSIGTEHAPSVTFYQFDFGYELALGDWTLTASIDDIVLYKAEFTVVPPSAAPELASVCGFEDLIG